MPQQRQRVSATVNCVAQESSAPAVTPLEVTLLENSGGNYITELTMKRFLTVALCSAVLGSPAFAGCTLPTAPAAIPDGKTADKELMMAKKKEVDQYKKDVEAYAACEGNASKVEIVQADLERVANRFNAAVRAFKAANSDT
jgi:hypothetical protein